MQNLTTTTTTTDIAGENHIHIRTDAKRGEFMIYETPIGKRLDNVILLWVSITEQLPEIGVDVLLFDDLGNGASNQHTQEMKVGYLVETISRQTANGIAVSCEWCGGDVFINITHWRTLRDPPKNE